MAVMRWNQRLRLFGIVAAIAAAAVAGNVLLAVFVMCGHGQRDGFVVEVSLLGSRANTECAARSVAAERGPGHVRATTHEVLVMFPFAGPDSTRGGTANLTLAVREGPQLVMTTSWRRGAALPRDYLSNLEAAMSKDIDSIIARCAPALRGGWVANCQWKHGAPASGRCPTPKPQ